MPFVKASIRFGRFGVALGATWSDPQRRDPAVQDASGAFIGHGPDGPDSPRRGRRRRAGILAGLLVIGVGLLCHWAIGSTLSSTESYPDGQTVRGTVVAVDHHYKMYKARRVASCTVEVEFTVGRETSVATDSYGTGEQCAMKGQQVEVSVLGSDPATARVILPSAQPMLKLGEVFVWLWVALGVWILSASLLGRRRSATQHDRPAKACVDETLA